MKSGTQIAWLILFFLLIELASPSSPFVRVGPPTMKSRLSVTSVSKKMQNASVPTHEQERESPSVPQGLEQFSTCHAATLPLAFDFQEPQMLMIWEQLDSSLSDQIDLTQLIRPPIQA